MKYFVTIKSTKISQNDVDIIMSPLVVGVLLFAWNIQDKVTATLLIKDLKTIRPGLLIAVDEEGGTVSRFASIVTSVSQLSLGRLLDSDVRNYFNSRSMILKESFMYNRSYGHDPQKL